MPLLLAVVLAICASAPVQSQGQPSNAIPQQNDQQKLGSQSLPLVVKVLPEEKSEDELAREDAHERSDRQLVKLTGNLARYTEFLFAATAGLFLATAGLVIVGFRQTRDARDAITAAVKSAAAAEKSADVAERSLIDLEGPFLYPVIEYQNIKGLFQPLDWYDHPTTKRDPVEPEIQFKIKNFGRSHAFPQSASAVFFWGQAEDGHADTGAGFVFDPLIEAGKISEHEIQRKMSNKISRDDHRSIMIGGAQIYLRGQIVFSDIFGNRYQQVFCLLWGPVTKKFMAWGPDRNRRKRISGPRRYN